MLVLTRKIGESVVIGDKSGKIGTVKVTRSKKDGRIGLAFDFPREFEIHRAEIYDLVMASKAKENP